MTARFLLLPIAALALTVAGCDSAAPPADGGLQATPGAPTANVGPTLGRGCSMQVSVLNYPVPVYFAIGTGPATVSATTNVGNDYYATITRGSGTGFIWYEYRRVSDNGVMNGGGISYAAPDCLIDE